LSNKDLRRYSRQVILEVIGEGGQEQLLDSSVAIIGCGALGTVISNNLVRAGIGKVGIIDRDLVEISNLQRQTLFDEMDIGRPKAKIAAGKLRKVNSQIAIESIVDDVHPTNIESLIDGYDLIIDATDNMETRLLLNDACIKSDIPWIYGGAIGTYGMSMNIIPGKTPCFRCLVPDLPGAGSQATCDTAGILNTIPAVIGSIESTEAIKILLGDAPSKHLVVYDIWKHRFQSIEIPKAKACVCCVEHRYEFLEAKTSELITPLCGSNAIQIIQDGKALFRKPCQETG